MLQFLSSHLQISVPYSHRVLKNGITLNKRTLSQTMWTKMLMFGLDSEMFPQSFPCDPAGSLVNLLAGKVASCCSLIRSLFDFFQPSFFAAGTLEVKNRGIDKCPSCPHYEAGVWRKATLSLSPPPISAGWRWRPLYCLYGTKGREGKYDGASGGSYLSTLPTNGSTLEWSIIQRSSSKHPLPMFSPSSVQLFWDLFGNIFLKKKQEKAHHFHLDRKVCMTLGPDGILMVIGGTFPSSLPRPPFCHCPCPIALAMLSLLPIWFNLSFRLSPFFLLSFPQRLIFSYLCHVLRPPCS